MGISHADLYRVLGTALGGVPYELRPGRIDLREAERRLTIRVGPERERRIASLRLPATALEFHFRGYTGAERERVLARFARVYHKGGG